MARCWFGGHSWPLHLGAYYYAEMRVCRRCGRVEVWASITHGWINYPGRKREGGRGH